MVLCSSGDCQLFFPHQVPCPHGPMLCFHVSSSHQLHFLQPVCLVSHVILKTQSKSMLGQHFKKKKKQVHICNRCSKDQMTTMHENGDSHHARFSFPAFRFVEQQNQTVSTYYLHCITRLCEISTCSDFKVSEKRYSAHFST